MLENPEIILGSPGSKRQVSEHDFIINNFLGLNLSKIFADSLSPIIAKKNEGELEDKRKSY